jgi:hypothetical protein
MNIVETANEVLNWVQHNPVDDAFGVAAIAIFGLASLGKWTEHRKNRREIDAINAELPEVKPVKLPPLDAEYRL